MLGTNIRQRLWVKQVSSIQYSSRTSSDLLELEDNGFCAMLYTSCNAPGSPLFALSTSVLGKVNLRTRNKTYAKEQVSSRSSMNGQEQCCMVHHVQSGFLETWAFDTKFLSGWVAFVSVSSRRFLSPLAMLFQPPCTIQCWAGRGQATLSSPHPSSLPHHVPLTISLCKCKWKQSSSFPTPTSAASIIEKIQKPTPLQN